MTKSKKRKPVTNQLHTADGEGLVLIDQVTVYPYHGINYVWGVTDFQNSLYVDVDSVASQLQHANSFRSLIRRTCRRDKTFIAHRKQSYLYNKDLGALFDEKTVTKWIVTIVDVLVALEKSSDTNAKKVAEDLKNFNVDSLKNYITYANNTNSNGNPIPFEEWLDNQKKSLADETKKMKEEVRLNHIVESMSKPSNGDFTYINTDLPADYDWDDVDLRDLPSGVYVTKTKPEDESNSEPVEPSDEDGVSDGDPEKAELYKTVAHQNIQISSLKQSNYDLKKVGAQRKRRIKKLTEERDGWEALANEWQVSYEEDLKHSGIHGWFYERFFSKEAKLRRKVRKHGVPLNRKEDDK